MQDYHFYLFEILRKKSILFARLKIVAKPFPSKMIIKQALVGIIAFLSFSYAIGQSQVVAAFEAPDTVCVNTPVTIKNLSSGVTTSYWNFCISSINTIPEGQNLGNLAGAFSLPVFSDFVQVNGNYYVFVVNNYPGSLVRLDFGSSMLNNPSVVPLGNFGGQLTNNAEGIQLVNVNGKWLAIIVGGFPDGGTSPFILKVDFGANITNTNPIATNWGNLGNMNYPIDLHVFQENNNWYGFTLNSVGQTMTRFEFGTDFSNPPVAVNLGSFGNFSGPTGIFAINDNGFWRVFITNELENSKITRLDFGSSLLNVPAVVDLGNTSNMLRRPRDIYIMKLCDEIVGFTINGNTIDPQYGNSLIRLNFRNGLGNPPEGQNLGNIGDLSFPHSISKLFRVGADLYCFITNVANNTITRLRFSGCTGINIPNSALYSPPDIIYSQPGTYNINLLVNEGLPTQTSFCKTITVVGNSKINLGDDTAICINSSYHLIPELQNVNSLKWSTGATTKDLMINMPGKYWAKSTNGNTCESSDTVVVTTKPLPIFSLGKDTIICKNTSLTLKAPINGDNYLWNTGDISSSISVFSSGEFILTIDKSGCSFSDTISIVKDPIDYVKLGNDTVLCGGAPITLNYQSRQGDVIGWSTGENSSSIIITTQGEYWVNVSNSTGCSGSDTIRVKAIDSPIFSLGPDTAICANGTIEISSPILADHYRWSSGATTSSISVSAVGLYTLTLSNEGCAYSDTINVFKKPLPVVKLGNDTAICSGQTLLLDLSGTGESIEWQDGSHEFVRDIQFPGIYKVTVFNNGCFASDEINIRDLGKPKIDIGTDTTICLGQPLLINPVISNGVFLSWEDGSGTPMRNINQPGTYIATASNLCGNQSDTLIVKTGGLNTSSFKMANAFSPNGDGRNDCFGLSKLLIKDLVDFSIYDRFGHRIFVGKRPEDCWDGKINGKMAPEGAYVYIVRAVTYCGVIERKGLVLLNR